MNPPRLRYRIPTLDDLTGCAEVLPPWLALPDALQGQLPTLWAGMLGHDAALFGVVEDLNQPAAQRIQGFGLTVIVPPELADAFARQPVPFSARLAYQGLASGRWQLPGERDIARANAAEGVSMLVLHYAQRNLDLQDPYCHSVLHEALEMFRIVHGGYRIQRFWQEGTPADLPFMLDMGFRCQADFDGDPRLHEVAPAARPQLWGLTREQALAQLPGTVVRMIFDHQPPQFRLSSTQRRLLALALFDDSDEALLNRLDVSPHGLKKLWRGIYERIEDRSPGFFGDAPLDDEGKRGPEKRRQVLAYVRQRLEEARPWPGGSS